MDFLFDWVKQNDTFRETCVIIADVVLQRSPTHIPIQKTLTHTDVRTQSERRDFGYHHFVVCIEHKPSPTTTRRRSGGGTSRRRRRGPSATLRPQRPGRARREETVAHPMGAAHRHPRRHPHRRRRGFGHHRRLEGRRCHPGDRRAQRHPGLRPGISRRAGYGCPQATSGAGGACSTGWPGARPAGSWGCARAISCCSRQAI